MSDRTQQQYLRLQADRESQARSYPRRFPLVIQKAKGVLLTDLEGKTYYDCLAGAGTLALGHNPDVVVEAIRSALDEQIPLHALDLATPLKVRFMSELFLLLPEEMRDTAKIQFCGPTGADAVEAAIKLVKHATGGGAILAFQGGYHGSTQGTMAMSGNLSKKSRLRSLLPDVHFLPFPYEYRCPFGVGNGMTARISAHYIEHLLDDCESGIADPCGVIVETVQGEGGSIPADLEWLRQLRRMTAERGIPLIIDEVQTGIGRTGKMFSFEHAGIVPDVIVCSKAIGGSLPMSVVIYKEELDCWQAGAHTGTFRGNQLGMAAGLATLAYMREHRVLDQVNERSKQFFEALERLKARYEEIGDVRGRGLMIGVEMVDPSLPKDGLGHHPPSGELAERIQERCFQNGLIVESGGRRSAVLRFLPPLTITEEETAAVLEIFEKSVVEAVEASRVAV
ncbi:diaminobutyrate--2-oxoglutarate transaminase [Paenibacillus pasadenensis]|uniref:Diaminobutyrate--2-oxoglutarate transaminase n=1 Tax=Paenibacillus pasadenensis TaxID=217090 RepID=A0A2N5N8D7_9BACL|nr:MULTISPECIES: diaminobutyrate--2-oxoglutarate transaminase [Paenibacillus]PLT46569.1 Siderophore biosynthesis diaminobutyrate--2-oxoglutarate aminotransferase [Paenibacillus pasadenensis]QGG56965.1 aminotransferase class III-fold pyridoxal phosphate-dependent enzyme [Paenibacillus sp. B01]